MPIKRIKLSVRDLMLTVALLAIPLSWAADKTGQRRDRCLDLADRHSRLGAEYRRNSGGLESMLHAADWHSYMSRCFEEAADRPWEPIPKSMPIPPKRWSPPSPAATDAGATAAIKQSS
ncbi:MAG: hypothetical protein P4L85_28080 [Paludisphaera borealis]|uniref:hypothetical protein n=1 Tax=Paludisphaera borealis TaxID=1387353 RepID=UPI0028501DAD|nr:hypothetical protein [Paludisphaera borealis]MDR3623245.1 hypothetical protein [Paludisphaera borealis]